MQFAKLAAQSSGTGLRDSSLKFPASSTPLKTTKCTVDLTALVHTVIEEPIALAVSTGERKGVCGRNFGKVRAGVLSAGEVRPYTADEERAAAGTELASGKALHTFVGHYRQLTEAFSTHSSPIKEGYGAMYFADGGFFMGQWSNNQRCGMGAFYSSIGYAYEGEFRDDVPHGRGVEYFPEDQIYVGEFAEGRPHNFGVTYCHRNGFVYAGDYSRGEKHGRGVVFYANGDVFEGNWVSGRRTGEGISTTYEVRSESGCTGSTIVRHCFRAEWQCDSCNWETLRIDRAHEPPSLEQYMDSGIIQPFEGIESPLGYCVGTLSMAEEFVRDIPPVLLRRLGRCFDALDETFTGEVPLEVIELAFAPYLGVNRKKTLESILKMAQLCKHDSSPMTHVNFFSFLWGLFPHLSEAEIQRHIVQELRLEVLLRLRGELADVVSGKNDGFLQLVQAGSEGEANFLNERLLVLRQRRPGRNEVGHTATTTTRCFSSSSSIGKKRNVGECRKCGDNDDVKTAQLTVHQLDAARGFVGGVRVPRALFLRQKVLHGNERLDFCALLEGLYPCVDPRALRRCEMTFIPLHVFHGYVQEFSRFDETNAGVICIKSMVAAKQRFLAFRAKGYERIPHPGNALERYAVQGERRNHVQWEIGDIALSVAFATYIDRTKSGSISFADLLRHAYPNVPCAVTRGCLMSDAAAPHHMLNDMELVGQSDEGATAAAGNAFPLVPSTNAAATQCCSCCVCVLCVANSLPLGAARCQ